MQRRAHTVMAGGGGLPAVEHRILLRREGPACILEILCPGEVRLSSPAAAAQPADRGLVVAGGQRAALGDAPRQCQSFGFDLVVGYDPRQKAFL
ncbi:MAG: hypothetical protein QOG73_4162 [Acetobacteraceae bacterium]|jgi:hypothetical protein|nr:hypothetical protein [Acetobacteraceae bacterium]